jgi:hypothetical protein
LSFLTEEWLSHIENLLSGAVFGAELGSFNALFVVFPVGGTELESVTSTMSIRMHSKNLLESKQFTVFPQCSKCRICGNMPWLVPFWCHKILLIISYIADTICVYSARSFSLGDFREATRNGISTGISISS